MTVSKIARYFCICLFVFCFSACQTQKEPEQENQTTFEEELAQNVYGVLSIHSIVQFPKDAPTELTVPDFFYSHIVVDSVPWLTSKDIKDILPVSRPMKFDGVYDLQIILTKHGREQWQKLLEADSNTNFAVLIDGVLYQTFSPRRLYRRRSDSIVIDGPFNDVIVKQLHKRAPFNYLKLNGLDKKILEQKKLENAAKNHDDKVSPLHSLLFAPPTETSRSSKK